MNRWLGALVSLVAAVGLSGCGSVDVADAKVSRSFFGVAPQDPPNEVEFARMGRGQVGSYHVLLSWARIGRDPGRLDWAEHDEVFEQLAINGIEPIPYLFGTPAHIADDPSEPPVRTDEGFDEWLQFVDTAVRRYGPEGEFWTTFALRFPGVEPRPVKVWEIWNEQNGPAFWLPEPSPGEYAKLLKRSSGVIKRADPDAQVMFGGMFATPSSELSILAFKFLRKTLNKKGVVEAIDAVAVHPYGPAIKDVKQQMNRTVKAMRKSGAGDKRTIVTEIGWGSNPETKSQLAKTPAEQAKLLRQSFEIFIKGRKRWNLDGVLWYTWRDPASSVGLCGWCADAGLLDRDLDGKPAWVEFTKFTGGTP